MTFENTARLTCPLFPSSRVALLYSIGNYDQSLTQIIREASTVGASWRYEEMWHFGDRVREKESGDGKSIS